MDYKKYIENIEEKFRKNFDFKKNYYYQNTKIDLFGKYSLRNEKYVGSKKLSIYAFENHEYCFLKYFKNLDYAKLEDFIELLKTSIDDFVEPHTEHMSTFITGIIVLDEDINEELTKKIKKYKFHKGFAFGFKGWADIRLILVNLKKGEVVTNQKGKEVKNFYQF